MISRQKLIPILLFFISGTFATFGIFCIKTAYKLQSSVSVTQGPYHKAFFHPYMQCFTMFIGEALCIIFYFATINKTNGQQLQQGKEPHKPWIFIVPALIDSFASSLSYISLSFVDSSTWLIFGGLRIVWVALFSKIIIKSTFEKWHFVGCTLAVLGVTIVGGSTFLNFFPIAQTQQVVGYIIMVVSLIFSGLFLVYEQYLLSKHTIDPLEMVGYQGIFGMVITLILSFVLSVIPCHFGQENCVYNVKGDGFFELPIAFIREVFSSLELSILVAFGLVSLGIFNVSGVKITQFFGALTRSLLATLKTSVTWAVGIVITLLFKNDKAMHVESLNVGVNIVKAVGFGFTILGTLIFNKLILQKFFESNQAENKNDENDFKVMNEEISIRE